MKRFVSLALVLILVLAFALTVCSCGEKATCSTCNKEKYVKDMDKIGEIAGHAAYICHDCIKAAEDAADDFKDIFD